MALSINQNLTSLIALNNLNSSSSKLETSIDKISSGLRIRKAADDPAGLCVSEKLKTQIRGMRRAVLNAQDGVSMLQTAEGGLQNTQSILQRLRELAVQSANDTHTSSDRFAIHQEAMELLKQINEIAGSTEFNTKKLLNGSQSAIYTSSSKFGSAVISSRAHASGDYTVTTETVRAGISQVQHSGLLTDRKTGLAATGSTALEDIAEFYDANGVFALADSKELNLTGNGKNGSVHLDDKMTLNQFVEGLQQAASSDEKGLGITNSSAQLIESPDGGTYIRVVSGAVGSRGKFSIIGSEALNSSLGFTDYREAEDSYVKVSMTDREGNVTTSHTSSDRATGLLNGVDIRFTSQAAQVSGVGGIEKGLRLTSDESAVINLGGKKLTVTLAAGDWSMKGIAASINSQLEKDADFAKSGIRASVSDGEIRLGYDASAHSIQNFKIEQGFGTLGITAGEYGYAALGTKDKDAEISGFSRYRNDAASKDIKFNVNGRAIDGFSTITNAELPDLAESSAFASEMNNRLEAASTGVRFDIVNGSMAFTTKNLGKDNRTNAKNVLDISVTDENGNRDEATLNQFGLTSLYAQGTGDTSFRLHISDSSPTLQIGANQGQTMTVSMGDMSSYALGIDNIDLTTAEGSEKALTLISRAMDKVVGETSTMGAWQNRLGYTMNNLQTSITNMTAAQSRIADVDIAFETMEMMKNQIKQQAGLAMVAQANSSMGNILTLLGK